MYSHLVFVSKIKPDSLLEAQTFNNNHCFTNRILYKQEKPGDFRFRQNGQTKTWCIRTDKSYCMSEYFPKAM